MRLDNIRIKHLRGRSLDLGSRVQTQQVISRPRKVKIVLTEGII